MLQANNISCSSAFASGFHDRGYKWAGNLVATGKMNTFTIIAEIVVFFNASTLPAIIVRALV